MTPSPDLVINHAINLMPPTRHYGMHHGEGRTVPWTGFRAEFATGRCG